MIKKQIKLLIVLQKNAIGIKASVVFFVAKNGCTIFSFFNIIRIYLIYLSNTECFNKTKYIFSLSKRGSKCRNTKMSINTL